MRNGFLKLCLVGLLIILWVPVIQGQSAHVLHNDLNSTKWTNSTITTAIHNETLSAYICNSTGQINVYDDFTTWTENDGVNRLTETETRVTFSNLQRTDLVWLWDNKAGELQNFVIEFKIKLTSIYNSASTVRFDPIMISNVRDTYNGNRGSQSTQFGIQLRSWSTTTGYNLLPIETYGPSTYYTGTTANILSKNVLYYVRLTKSGTSLNLKVDNNEDFSSLISDYTLTLHANHNLNYIMMPQSAELNTPCPSYGYMEYLWFGETEGGYDSGYLFTEDLLSNYTGTPFSLIYNVSAPSGQGFNVSVSQDGEAWNTTDESSLTDYLVSYLEPFNWTSLYVRFGFETDKTDTPVLYDYHLTLYTETGSGDDDGLTFGDLNWMLAVIWLVLLMIGWIGKIYPVRVIGGVFGMVVGIYFLTEDTLVGVIVVFFSLILFVLSAREK